MSRDVSLVFDVNVGESTQVIKSQLQGIFEEINKQPHSIKVAIDGASFNNAISKLQEIRELMSETDTFRGSGYYLDDISLGINRLRAQLDLMNTNITGAKYNFEIFAQNSLGDITSFTGGISFLNEELIRMRKLLDEISRKEVSFYGGGGGMTGSEAGDLSRAANGIEILKGELETLRTTLGEIRNDISNINNSIGTLTSSMDGQIEIKAKSLIELLKQIETYAGNASHGIGLLYGDVKVNDTLMTLNKSFDILKETSNSLKTRLLEIQGLIEGLGTKNNGFSDFNEVFELSSTLTAIKDGITNISSAFKSSEGNIVKLETHFDKVIEQVDLIRYGIAGVQNALSSSGSWFNIDAFDKLGAIDVNINTLTGSFSQLKTAISGISEVLNTVFYNFNPENNNIINLDDRISNIISSLNSMSYGSNSQFRYTQADELSGIAKGVQTLVEAFTEFKQILIDISGLISQINSKDFNITNKFAVPKVDNTKKEIALVKQEAIEAYRVIEQLISAFETLSKGSHKQELFGALLNNGGQYDNIYSVLTALDQLGTSIDDIQKKQRLDGLNAIKTQLNGLLTDLTNLVSIVNANTGIKILSPDTSALTKAREELDALLKETTAVEDAVRKAALNAMTANPTTTTTTISASSRSAVNESINTVTSDLNNIKSQVDTFITDTNEKLSRMLSLSDIKTSTMRVTVFANEIKSIVDSMITEINGKLNGLFEMQKLSGISEQVGGYISKVQTEFDSLKVKVIEGIAEIQTALNSITMPQITTSGFSLDGIRESLSALKTEISSVMGEVKSAIDTTLGSISSSKIALPIENIKEYLTVLESIQGAHGNMGEVAAQFKDLATTISGLTVNSNPETLESIVTVINSIDKSLLSLNETTLNVSTTLSKFSDSILSLTAVKSADEIKILKNEISSLYKMFLRYESEIARVNGFANEKEITGKTVGDRASSIMTSYKAMNSYSNILSDGVKRTYTSLQDMKDASDKVVEGLLDFQKGRSDAGFLNNLKNDLLEMIKLYDTFTKSYNQFMGHDNLYFKIRTTNLPSVNEINAASNQLVEYQKAKENVSKVSVVNSDEIPLLERYADIINEIKNQFDLLKNDVVKGLAEIKTAISSLPKEMKITIGGKGAADLKAQTAEIQEQAEAEKALSDAAVAEGQAEEGRKISLSQFLTLYTKLLDLQNKGTHLSNTEQYQALTDSINTLMPVYDMYKDKTENIENIIKGAEAAEIDLAKAFDAGTIAAKQFEAAIPNSADGAKIQNVLKAIGNANNVISKYNDANGDKGNQSYLNLINLTAELDSKVNQTRDGFKELGTETIDAGDKISEIMRRIAVEVENVRNETAKAVASNKSNEDIFKTKTYSTLTSLTSVMGSAQNKSSALVDTDAYKAVEEIAKAFKQVIRTVETDGIKTEEAFRRIGRVAETELLKAQIASYTLKTAINETSKETTTAEPKITALSKAWESLNKSQKLINENPVLRNTDVYTDLLDKANKLSDVIKVAEEENITLDESFKKLGVDAKQVFEGINASVGKFTNTVINYGSSTKGVTEEQVYAQIKSYSAVIKSARANFSDSGNFARLQDEISLLDSALKFAKEQGVDIEAAFSALGTTGQEAFTKGRIAAHMLSIEMNNTNISTETAVNEMKYLASAYTALSKAQTLTTNNPVLQTTDEYRSLVDSSAKLSEAIELSEKDSISLSQAFANLKMDGEKVFDGLTLAVSRFKEMVSRGGLSGGASQLDVMSQLSSLTTLINSKSAQKAIGTDTFNNVTNSIEVLKSALDATKDSEITLEQAFINLGTNSVEALNAAKIAAYALKIETAENKAETESEKQKVYELSNAYKELVKAEGLINKNPALKNTTAYTELTGNVSQLTQVIDYAEKNNISFTESLNTLKISGDKIFEDLKVSISKFNLEAMKTPLTLKQVRDALTEMQNLMNRSANAKASQDTEAYNQLTNAALRTKKAIALVVEDGIDLNHALQQLGFEAPKYLSECADITSAFKVELSAAAGAAKKLGEENKKTNKEAREGQALLGKAQALSNKMQTATAKWTMAKTGKTSGRYSTIVNEARELETLIQRYKSSEVTVEKFKSELERLTASFKNNSQAIISAGENTRSFAERFSNFSRYFGMWFGFSRIIMQTISTLKQMINTSIELDDAFTQLQIVTQNTESSYEKFGRTVADVAKRTATSMADITSSATTFARLGFSLEESAQIAEYTAMLQNVGDIDVSDAQDAITAILKAYGMGADKMEEIMDKLVTTGNHFPISVSQIAEGMNNASSALAAAGNSFDQSVALLTAANVTINLCRVA